MKQLYTIVFLFIICGVKAQTTLSFDYDESGNQKLREIICVNCRTANGTDQEVTNQEFTESADFPQISFYPNPVQEELFIKWELNENLYISSLEVYNIQGQFIYSKDDLSQANTTSISFGNLAQGMYVVSLVYNNGEKKDLKVIKK